MSAHRASWSRQSGGGRLSIGRAGLGVHIEPDAGVAILAPTSPWRMHQLPHTDTGAGTGSSRRELSPLNLDGRSPLHGGSSGSGGEQGRRANFRPSARRAAAAAAEQAQTEADADADAGRGAQTETQGEQQQQGQVQEPSKLPPRSPPLAPVAAVASGGKNARDKVKSRWARTGTLFGRDFEDAPGKRLWARVQSQIGVGQQQRAEKFNIALPKMEDEGAQEEIDAMSEEEWEERMGLRAPIPPPFLTTEYLTVDDDLPRAISVPVGRTPRHRGRSADGRPLDSSRQVLVSPAAAQAAPSPTRAELHQLASFDCERAPTSFSPLHPQRPSTSGGRSPAPAGHGVIVPPAVLTPARLAELEQRSRIGWKSEARTQQHQPEEKEGQSELSSPAGAAGASPAKILRSAASTPQLLSSPADQWRSSGKPSLPALHFLDAQRPSSGVLTPRARYEQLGRACEQIPPTLPTSPATIRPATAAAAKSSTSPRPSPPLHTDLSVGLHQRIDGRPVTASPASMARKALSRRPSSSNVTTITFALPSSSSSTDSPDASPRTGRSGLPKRGDGAASKPGTPRSARTKQGNKPAWTRMHSLSQSPSIAPPTPDATEDPMQSLRMRSLLPTEYLRLMERQQVLDEPVHVSSSSSGLSALAHTENMRIASKHASSTLLHTGGSVWDKQYSSAAILAAQEALMPSRPTTAEGLPHPDGSSSPLRSGHSPVRSAAPSTVSAPASAPKASSSNSAILESHPSPLKPDASALHLGELDPQVAEVAAAARAVMVTRPQEASPAGVAGHGYMNAYALHHHLPLNQRGGGGSALTARAQLRPGTAAATLGSASSFCSPPPPRMDERLELDVHLIDANGFDPSLGHKSSMSAFNVPLPSSSPALAAQSPSALPGWQPPSVSCNALTEEIYAATRTLKHLLSSGEGRAAHDRFVHSIRPARLVEEARRKAMLEASVAAMKATAAAKHARQVKEAQERTAMVLAMQQERERMHREKMKLKAHRAAAVAMAQAAEEANAANEAEASAPVAPVAPAVLTVAPDAIAPAVPAAAATSPTSASAADAEDPSAQSPKAGPVSLMRRTSNWAILQNLKCVDGVLLKETAAEATNAGDAEKMKEGAVGAAAPPAAPSVAIASSTTTATTTAPTVAAATSASPASASAAAPAAPKPRVTMRVSIAEINNSTGPAVAAGPSVPGHRRGTGSARFGSTSSVFSTLSGPSSPMSTMGQAGSPKSSADAPFSRHRPSAPSSAPTAGGGSAAAASSSSSLTVSHYGPAGENLLDRRLQTIPPATRDAGQMLDEAIASASDSAGATTEQRRLAALNEYNNALARLYVELTPQQKRFKRLDQKYANREDVRRVVEASVGKTLSRYTNKPLRK